MVIQDLIRFESDGAVTHDFEDYIIRLGYKPLTYSQYIQV